MRTWQRAALMAGVTAILIGSTTGYAAQDCRSSYTIDLTVELSSEMTRGQSNLMIELRKGAVGNSTVFETKRFAGRTGTVAFTGMCQGGYFIAIGNGDKVAVGPVRQFDGQQSVHTRVRLSSSSGNVGSSHRRDL